jgi:hypothetical protein
MGVILVVETQDGTAPGSLEASITKAQYPFISIWLWADGDIFVKPWEPSLTCPRQAVWNVSYRSPFSFAQ